MGSDAPLSFGLLLGYELGSQHSLEVLRGLRRPPSGAKLGGYVVPQRGDRVIAVREDTLPGEDVGVFVCVQPDQYAALMLTTRVHIVCVGNSLTVMSVSYHQVDLDAVPAPAPGQMSHCIPTLATPGPQSTGTVVVLQTIQDSEVSLAKRCQARRRVMGVGRQPS